MPDMVPRYLGEEPKNTSLTDISDDVSRAIFWEQDTKQHVIRAVSDGVELCRLPPTELATRCLLQPRRASYRPLRTWTSGRPCRSVDHRGFQTPADPARSSDGLRASLSTGRPCARPGIDGWDPPGLGPPDRGRGSSLTVARHDATSGLLPCTRPSRWWPAARYFTTRVLLRDYHTGQVVQTIDPPWQGGSTSLAWHPDGRRLFVAAGDTDEVQEYRFDPTARTLSPARHASHNRARWQQNLHQPGRRSSRELAAGAVVAGILDLETGRVLFQFPADKSRSRTFDSVRMDDRWLEFADFPAAAPPMVSSTWAMPAKSGRSR